MDVLETLISNLTSDEVRRFKILSNRFKADDEKKLIILFDALRSDKYLNQEDDLVKELYVAVNAQTKNRYYRLRNKLLDNIEKSLVFYHFKYKDSIHAYYDIQLSILLKERGNYDLAHYFLRKAEKKATELDQFTILETIYEEYVQLAMRDIVIDIAPILTKRQTNLEKIKLHRKNTEALALITQELKRSNFSRGNASVLDLLNKVRRRLERSEELFQSAEARILSFRTVSTILIQKKAFRQLVEYLDNTIREFEELELFNNNTHATRLLMRLWLINGLYKTRQFERALRESDQFEREMKLYNRQNFYTYLFHFYNSRVNILKCMGRAEEAGAAIEESLSHKEIRSDAHNYPYALLMQADHQFNQQDYGAAVKTLVQLKSLRDYAAIPADIRICMEVFELVCRSEAGEHSDMEARVKQLRKDFRAQFRDEQSERLQRFLEILTRMSNAVLEGKRVSLRAASRDFEHEFGKVEHGDNEIIMYDVYLRSKLENRPYYEMFVAEMKALSI